MKKLSKDKVVVLFVGLVLFISLAFAGVIGLGIRMKWTPLDEKCPDHLEVSGKPACDWFSIDTCYYYGLWKKDSLKMALFEACSIHGIRTTGFLDKKIRFFPKP